MIAEFSVTTTQEAAQLAYRVRLEEGVTPASVELLSDETTVTRNLDGRTQQVTGTIAAPDGNAMVEAVVRDDAGHEATARTTGYARQYAVQTETSHTLGAAYNLGAGGSWQDCIDGRPAVGEYGVPPRSAVVDRHVDQAQSAGIQRWIVNVARPRHLRGAESLGEGSLAEEMPLEFDIDLPASLDNSTAFEEFLTKVGDAIDSLPAYHHRDGRPVVTFSRLAAFDDQRGGWIPNPRITSAFDSPTEFIETVRSTIGGDTTPYLVGDLGIRGMLDYQSRTTAEYRSFAGQFDALYEAPWNPGEGAFEWETAFSRTFDWFWAARLFADHLGIAFEPVVFPGWDHTVDRCRDSAERIPRSPSHLTAMLEAADLLGTTDRIRIHSFNDWHNGTQLEPGAVHGDDYGRGYLDAIESFQAADRDRSLYGRDEYYVSPTGSDRNVGSEQQPLQTIQQALNRARPGTTIHVQPGTYKTPVSTVRGGTSDAPITITGPRDAVFNANGPFEINHSHVHLKGLTFDGLHTPSAPEDVDSYSESILQVNETLYETIKSGNYDREEVPEEAYVTDVVVKPHAIGNCRSDLIKVHWSQNVEVGEFEVIGPAGVKYLKSDTPGHNGEIVYVGNPINKGYPVDETNNVHIHHIDNSAGYAHNEMVDVKGGAHDVLIEYCTTANGGEYILEGHDRDSECVVHLGGRDCVLRWCDIKSSQGQAVEVASWGPAHPERFEENTGVELPDTADTFGIENSIYGNRFVNYAGLAVQYPIVYPDDGDPHIAEGFGPDEQAHICDNTIDGPTHGTPTKACDADRPTTDQIGHLGGDSPWDS